MSNYTSNKQFAPHSKLNLQNVPLVNSEEEDEQIPDEHTNRTNHHGSHNHEISFLLSRGKKVQGSVPLIPKSKKLTHGLTFYEDIKLANIHNQSRNQDNIKTKESRKNTNSLNKSRNYLDMSECTFTPKTNRKFSPYKNFKEFTNSQDKFLNKREENIKKMKHEIEIIKASEFTGVPTIHSTSRNMTEGNEIRENSYQSSAKKKVPFHERLYEIPQRREYYSPNETFTPKILSKSKNLSRNDKVENLLYSDAQRRQGQQKLIESSLTKKGGTSGKHSPLRSEKQNKFNNMLICKKLRTEFLELLQVEEVEERENKISAILAITIISELFNVDLDPNRNEIVCSKILHFLIHSSNAEEDQEGSIQTQRLWEFIKAIIIGSQGTLESSLTKEEMDEIHRELGYFYSRRLSKEPNRWEEPEVEEYKMEASEKTNRLAENYREKKIEQVAQFFSTETETFTGLNSIKPSNNSKERIIRLEDLLILDSIRQRSVLENEKKAKEELEIKGCTFKPSLNENSVRKASEKRARNNRTNNEERCEMLETPNLSAITDKNSSATEEKLKRVPKKKKVRDENHIDIFSHIKDMDKTLLRLNLGRKIKDLELSQRSRGYNKNDHDNWLQGVQQQKKQILKEVSNFLGYQPPEKGREFGQCLTNANVWNGLENNYRSCHNK